MFGRDSLTTVRTLCKLHTHTLIYTTLAKYVYRHYAIGQVLRDLRNHNRKYATVLIFYGDHQQVNSESCNTAFMTIFSRK